MPATIQIGTVCDRTGINPVTLRAWERRYGLIKPQRTEKGRRLYSLRDIEQIKKISALVKEGIPVSQVQKVLDSELFNGTSTDPQADIWQKYHEKMRQAICQFDEHRLESVYNEAISLHAVSIVMMKLIVPLFRELGDDWSNGQTMISEEHFFRVFIRNKIGAMLHHQTHKTYGAPLIAACMPGETHDLGLLMLSLNAAESGYRMIILGANTPLEDLPLVAKRSNSRAVILSSSIETSEAALKKSLQKLKRKLSIPTFIGGLAVETHQEMVSKVGITYLGSDLPESVARISAQLKKFR